MLRTWCYATTLAFIGIAAALTLSGCPGDVGVSLIVTPDLLNYGATENRQTVEVAKNFSATPSNPIVATANAAWIIPEECTDSTQGCLAKGPLRKVKVPVRIDRERMTLGKNEGILFFNSGNASLAQIQVAAIDILQINFKTSSNRPEVDRAVTFTNMTQTLPEAGAIQRFEWQFGDGETSTQENPVHTYRTPGTYAVTLTVTTENTQESHTKTSYINVITTAPQIDFDVTETNVAEKDTVTFNNLTIPANEPILSYQWDFGDGITSTDKNPSHQYLDAGLYTVTLNATTRFKTHSKSKANYISVQHRKAPVADFALSQSKPYMLVPVEFQDISEPGSAAIEQWIWEFGDGTLSNQQNPTHTYENIGNYDVKLTVITKHGSHSTTRPIEVTYMPPTADFQVEATAPSVGETLTFEDLSLPGTAPIARWIWNFGDGVIETIEGKSTGTTTHIYEKAGVYTVSLAVIIPVPENNTDQITKKDYLTVIKAPTPDFSFAPQNAFVNQTITFTNQSVLGSETEISYQWDLDGDPETTADVVTEQDTQFTYTDPGTYNVILTAMTPTRETSVTRAVVVDIAPTPDFTVDNTTGNTVDPIQFTNTSTSQATDDEILPIQAYLWEFGDGETATESDPQHVYQEKGVYTVSLTVIYQHSGTGETLQSQKVQNDFITIGDPIPPTAAFSSNLHCITNDTQVRFSAEASLGSGAGSPVYYEWDFGDGSQDTGETPRHTYRSYGNFTVTLTVTTDDKYAPFNTDTVVIEDFINVSEGQTALNRYVDRADNSYKYTVVDEDTKEVQLGLNKTLEVDTYAVEMTSQTWRSTSDYAHADDDTGAVWTHEMYVFAPKQLTTNTGMLFIDGGSNQGKEPSLSDIEDDEFTQKLLLFAAASGSVITLLRQVPNEPLEFSDERAQKTRTEDDIIAYTYDEFMKAYETGAEASTYEDWPLLLPMVKSAVQAMDTVQNMYSAEYIQPCLTCGTEAEDRQPNQDFMVAGASKRGWTTWLTAAADDRVKAIAPIVIDVLNMDKQMEHHFNSYGYWSPAIYSYVQEKVFDRLGTEAGQALMNIIDPYEYRCVLDLPKFIMNSSGDQFFLPDSSQWYFDRMDGEKYLNYVPNTAHSMDGAVDLTDDQSAATSLLSFYLSVINDGERPQFDWTFENDGSIKVTTTTSPTSVTLWQAINPDTRDFRLDKIGPVWTSSILSPESPNVYRGQVELPETGYIGFFLQLQFANRAVPSDLPIQAPFTFTTPIRVLPETEAGDNLYPSFDGERYALTQGDREVPMVVLHGDAEEMGRQYGRLMSDEINAFIPAFLKAAQTSNPNLTNTNLDAAWNAIAQSADPTITDAPARLDSELRGIAETSGIDLVTLQRANMVAVVDDLSGNAVFATRNATTGNNTYQSNSLNWSLNLGLQDYPCIAIYVPARTKGFPHINVSFAGLVGCLTGINLSGISTAVVDDPDNDILQGNHYTALFREILFDAASIEDGKDIVDNNVLMGKQHFIVGDGRNLQHGVKYHYSPDLLGGSDSWNDIADNELVPLGNILPNILYSGPESGAVNNGNDGPIYQVLRSSYGAINPNTLAQVNETLVANNNLLNVIYSSSRDSFPLYAWIAYAQGNTPAAQSQMILIDLQEYLP